MIIIGAGVIGLELVTVSFFLMSYTKIKNFLTYKCVIGTRCLYLHMESRRVISSQLIVIFLKYKAVVLNDDI